MVLDVTLSFDSLSRVDSSARFGFGPYPQILSSLSGPIEVRLASEQPSQSTLDVHVRPLSNAPGTESKFYAAKIAEIVKTGVILEANPRTLLQLVVQILVPLKEREGNGLRRDELMASMINACTLALLHAGSIPMRGVVCAIAIGRAESSNNDPSYIVSPTNTSSLAAGGCFAFLFTDPRTSHSATCVWSNWRSLGSHSPSFDESSVVEARSAARDAAKEVWERMKGLVEEGEIPKPASSPTKSFKMKKVKDVDEVEGEKMSMDEQAEDEEAKMEI